MMKRKLSFLFALLILVQSLTWHYDDLKAIKTFVSDAFEHLEEGDSFMDFLQMHYGKDEVVKNHLKKEHSDRTPQKDHGHHFENIVFIDFQFQEKWLFILMSCNNNRSFWYTDKKYTSYLKLLDAPPELI